MVSQSQRQASGIDGRGVAAAALGVLLLIVMATAMVRLLATLAGTSTQAVSSGALLAPALSSTDETRQLTRYRAAQAARLESYGWDDAAHRFAHIPIARAMQLLIEQPQLRSPQSQAPATASSGKPAPVDVPRQPDKAAPLAGPR